MTEELTALFNLPKDVKFCKRCGISNQRPSSAVEFKNVNKKETIFFDDTGVCSACRFHDMKYNEFDWNERERQLVDLLDKHRSPSSDYDVIVPGSGGKDSFYVAHTLKHRYGMHPLTVTWPPQMYTDIGWRNFISWLDMGFANISIHPNRQLHKEMTRAAFLNLCHPFQPFIVGQKQVGPKTALRYGVKLVFYGESQAENGNNIEEGLNPRMNRKYYTKPSESRYDAVIGGVHYNDWLTRGFSKADLDHYIPIAEEGARNAGVEVHHMGYYHRWRPQDIYYYAVEHGKFQPNQTRSEGTYSKYASLDDRIDGFHYYTTFIKFGIGRAAYDSAQETRNGHLTREEAVALIHKYDGEFPKKYFKDFLEYCDISEDQFWKTIDKNRSPHLWRKSGNEWALRFQIS